MWGSDFAALTGYYPAGPIAAIIHVYQFAGSRRERLVPIVTSVSETAICAVQGSYVHAGVINIVMMVINEKADGWQATPSRCIEFNLA